ncbi:hypothetical protein HPB49_004971 [Dermacentor silvarum]|uniref:Uncharacterized protein n=1 Tax=Dermacentor silvarum TaxID=543639 RepID=A0ACB8CJH2_DERSI|nr:hypothetical protein HPB49_004971 [Dermacentor silvarum]
MARKDTNMRRVNPLEKCVAIGLHLLAKSAKDRTVANLYGVSRSSVTIISKGWQSTCVSAPLLQGFLKELAPWMAVILKSALRKNTPPTTSTIRGGAVPFFSL